jgi:hypothetical protein
VGQAGQNEKIERSESALMTNEHFLTLETAIYQAIEALPDGDDRQLTDWVVANCLPSFSEELKQALVDERVMDIIREVALELGVTLKD